MSLLLLRTGVEGYASVTDGDDALASTAFISALAALAAMDGADTLSAFMAQIIWAPAEGRTLFVSEQSRAQVASVEYRSITLPGWGGRVVTADKDIRSAAVPAGADVDVVVPDDRTKTPL